MAEKTLKNVRKSFLNYFSNKNHQLVDSSNLVPSNDPTLMFTNSGMVQFKNVFTGLEKRDYKRATTSQKCVRAGGKHNDLENVGYTPRHHTFFEMLGNFSFGDYFKEKAISLAWDLITKEFGISKDKLYVTVFKDDDDAFNLWKKVAGLNDNRVIRIATSDNFWSMGETGPCGPCSEIFFDHGDHLKGGLPGTKDQDGDRYIEIWNAGVFMELNKQKDGTFKPLPLKSVDTGSGLERLAMVMNGHESVYETDLLKPLIDLSAEMLGDKTDKRAERMISDHMRASVMILAEGVMPGNEGQGYIPRRLIRKCVAACIARNVEPNFKKHIDKVVELLSDYYPQLKSAHESINYNIEQEVNDFVATVKSALSHMDGLDLKENKLSGKDAFELVTTHGMPYDVLMMFAKDRGLEVDEASFEKHYEEHRKTSRVISRKSNLSTDQEKLEEAFLSEAETIFSGYDMTSDTSKVLKIYSDKDTEVAFKGDTVYFSSEKTPFYGESGGQAGDIGYATLGAGKVEIQDTLKIKGTHVHAGVVIEGEIRKGETVDLEVDERNRNAVKRNHSATHLLHAALHQVVGTHAVQKGSSVTNDRLRFDFQNPGPVSKEQLDQIEFIVNEWVMNNSSQAMKVCSYEEAIDSGAMALFGEKYDSEVRVISFGPDSVELCGGTHVTSTGDIGLFLITAESSVAKGIRRIEAVTGHEAIKVMQERNNYLRQASDEMKTKPAEVATKIKELKLQMKQKIKEAKESKSNSEVSVDFETNFKVGAVSFYAAVMTADQDAIKEKGDTLLNQGQYQLVCLIGKEDKTLRTFMWSHQDINKKIKAGDALKKVLEAVNGRGGGRPNFAQGGSPEVQNVETLQQFISNDFKSWLETLV